MKRIICAVILICVMLTATSCKADMSKAMLAGYSGKTFEQTVDAYINAGLKEAGDEVSDASYEWKDGWVGEGAPDKSALESGKKAMTFVLTIELKDEEPAVFAFYFAYDRKDNKLIAQGGYGVDDGETEVMDKSEAREELDIMFGEFN